MGVRRNIFLSRPVSGLTLVECLVFVSIWAAVCISTFMLIRQASLTRGLASQRVELALIAQGELDRARSIPVAELTAGSSAHTSPDWPSNTNCTVTLAPHSAGTWLVDVQVERRTARPIKPVQLTSYRRIGP